MLCVVSLTQCSAEIREDYALRLSTPSTGPTLGELIPLPCGEVGVSLAACLLGALLVLGPIVEALQKENLTPPHCDDPALHYPSLCSAIVLHTRTPASLID